MAEIVRICDTPCNVERCRINDLYDKVLEMSADVGEIKGTMKSVEAEAKRTNSRVTHAEDDIASLKVWRGTVVGGAAVVGAFAATTMDWLRQRLGL